MSIGILKVRIQYVHGSLIMHHRFSWQLVFERGPQGTPPAVGATSTPKIWYYNPLFSQIMDFVVLYTAFQIRLQKVCGLLSSK